MKTLLENTFIKNIKSFATNYCSKINTWFANKPDKEKILLTICIALLSVSVLYIAVLSPIHAWRDNNKKLLLSQLESINSIQNNSQQIYRQLSSISKPKNITDKIALIKNTAFKYNIKLSKLETKENIIAVSADDTAYQKLLSWLIMLENDYKIGIVDISISKSKKYGIVKSYVVLD